MIRYSKTGMLVDVCVSIPYTLRERVREATPRINLTHAVIAGLERELQNREQVEHGKMQKES